jgi:glycosyltransferase involved in cell wall biosynthesis
MSGSNAPLVSFLVAVRNRPALVCRTIASVPLDDPSVEVVVVDDGSTDDTVAHIVSAFGSAVTIERHLTNLGAGAARNTAARAATGNWCFILDSDNVLAPNALETIRSCVLAVPAGTGIVYLGSVGEGGGLTGSKTVPDGAFTYEDLLVGRVAGEYCAMPRREALLEVPYTERRGRDTPGVTWLEIARRWGGAAFDLPVLLYTEQGEDRLSSRAQTLRDPIGAALCHEEILERFGADLRRLSRRTWAQHRAKAAVFRGAAGERRAALRGGIASLFAAPSPLGLSAVASAIMGPRFTRRALAE